MWAVDMLSANMTSLRDQTRRTSEPRNTNRYELFTPFFFFGPDIPKIYKTYLLIISSYVISLNSDWCYPTVTTRIKEILNELHG